MRRILFFVVMICALLCYSLHAQSYLYNIGTQQWGTNLPIENGFINVNNGAIHMEFPLATHTQRGGLLQLQERLVYDSRIWQIVNSGSSYGFYPTNVPNSQGGWRFVAGNETGGVSTSESTQNFDCYVEQYQFVYAQDTDYFFSYQDPSGTRHMFAAMTQQPYGTPYNPETSPCQGQSLPNPPNNPTATGNATDGSGYSISITNYTSAVVYDASGNQVYPSVVDRNGNYYSSDSSGNLIDTIGRTPVLVSTNGNQTYYDVLTSGGGRSRYIVTTAAIPIRTFFRQSGVNEYSGTLTVVSSITLPDGSSYQFTYDDGSPTYKSGDLTSVTLPTGGVINYRYTPYFDSFQNVNRWLNTRIRDGGTTTYTPKVLSYCSSTAACQEQVTVTSPASNDTVYTFNLDSGAITQGKSWNTNIAAYQGSSTGGGTLLQSSASQYTYQTSYAQCPGPNPNAPSYCSANVPISLVQNHTLNDVGLTSQTVTALDYPWVNPTSVQFWDYYSGSAPSSPTQTTTYSYAHYYSFELPSQVSVSDGSGNLVSQTAYAYDETSGNGHAALVNVSGLPQQPGASPTYRANLTTITQSVSSSGTTVSSMASYDTAGMVRSKTDPDGTTTYTYDGTGAYASALNPPTPFSGVSLASSATTDSNIGLESTATDANGTTKKVPSYDAFNRPNEEDSLDSASNLVAKTTYTYYPTALVTHIYQSASVFTDSEVLYDGYGRSSRTALSNGENTNPWYQQDTCYDTTGNVSFQSYSYSGTGFGQAAICSGSGGDSYTHDALGRVTLISHGDGSQALYKYGGRATQYTDENAVSRITQVDGLGHIKAVCEISSNSSMPNSGSPQACGLDIPGSGFLTTYTYDLANHKTTINQGAQVARIFITDAIGRQTSVQESEHSKAPTTFTYNYNPKGMVVTRTRPVVNLDQAQPLQLTTTTYQYDNAGRVLTISYNDGVTPTKTFNYDQPGNGGSIPNAGASKGRLTSMSNGVHGRSYQYDALGRVTETVECLPDWCGQSQHDVFRSYGYDWQGNLLNDQYATSGNNQSSAAVGYSYNRAGQLTVMAGGQNNAGSSIIYSVNAQTMVASGPQFASFGNGLNTTTQYDSIGRLNGRWLCNGPGGVNCPSGTYFYGFAIQQTGNRLNWSSDTVENRFSDYVYDDMGRLTGAHSHPGYNGLNFSATYDRYGNRWSESVTNTPSGTAPNPSLTYNTANNQPLYFSFDQAGNQTSDTAGNTYQYDAENNLISINNGSKATFAYSTAGERDKVSVGGVTDRYGVDLAGRRSTTWQDGSTSLKAMQYYNDQGPVAFWAAADGNIHFEHPDWEGSERLRTSSAGGVESSFTSLPFGESSTSSGPDYSPSHYALLDQDVSPAFGMSHAGAREYFNLQGHWMSPDPDQGSYDWTNPQSFNRYTYVMNNPMTYTDPSGKNICGATTELGAAFGGPVGGAIGTAVCVADLAYDLFKIFDLFGGSSFHGSLQPRPEGTGNPNWNNALNEHLGLQAGTTLTAPGLPGILGVPQQGCEFGACGGIGGDSFQQGAATAPISWCAEHPTICTVGADAAAFARAIPAVAASALLLNMEGDNKKPDPARAACYTRYAAEQNRCSAKYGGGGRFGNNRAKGACLDRAFYRYEACVNGTPDPGPPMASLEEPAKDREFADVVASLNAMVIDFGPEVRSAQ